MVTPVQETLATVTFSAACAGNAEQIIVETMKQAITSRLQPENINPPRLSERKGGHQAARACLWHASWTELHAEPVERGRGVVLEYVFDLGVFLQPDLAELSPEA